MFVSHLYQLSITHQQQSTPNNFCSGRMLKEQPPSTTSSHSKRGKGNDRTTLWLLKFLLRRGTHYHYHLNSNRAGKYNSSVKRSTGHQGIYIHNDPAGRSRGVLSNIVIYQNKHPYGERLV